jgi:hypothetical protein
MLLSILSFVHLLSGPLASPLQKPLAYLDPGSGSFILQILLASLLASLLFFRNFWSRLVGKFRKPGPSEDIDEQDDEDEPKG